MVSKMRVACIYPLYPAFESPDGSIRELRNITTGLVKKGCSVTVFATEANSWEDLFYNTNNFSTKRYEILDGVEVWRYPIEFRTLSHLLLKFRFLFSDNENIYLYDSDEVNSYIQEFQKSSSLFNLKKITNLLPILVPIRFPISRKLYDALLRAKDYDLYYVNAIILSHAVYAYKASIKNKIPLIIKPQFHSANKLYYNPINFKILKHADIIIANTNADVDIFSKFGVNPGKIITVGCAIDPEIYSSPDMDIVQKIRSDYKFDNYELNVLFLSRLQREKGVFEVINAVIELNKQHNCKVQLLIIGSDHKGNSKQIKRISAKYNFIKLVGYVSERDKIAFLHACDALVVPSIADSFGTIYLEAWACKKPVIGADIPSTRELISYGEDGFFAKYGDVHDLMQKIKFLLDNPEKRIEMGKKGYKKVLQNYTNKILVEKIYNIFRSILEKYRRDK